ncbi:hypothetical protein EDC04DRAFT_644176 [Pisolithus marmoratus]|nr:hypothetical protein EDC04DRAFT_644176 [Pisolithus marmoratus]
MFLVPLTSSVWTLFYLYRTGMPIELCMIINCLNPSKVVAAPGGTSRVILFDLIQTKWIALMEPLFSHLCLPLQHCRLIKSQFSSDVDGDHFALVELPYSILRTPCVL